MTVHGEWVRYGDEIGWLARLDRAAAPLPSVVVIQEVWGVDEHIRDVAERFARAGYVALAPDLWAERGERPAVVAPERVAEVRAFVDSMPIGAFMDPVRRDAAMAKLAPDLRARIAEVWEVPAKLDLDRLVPKLRAAVRWLREDNEATRGQKVGAVGFCLGGGLAGRLAAAEPALAAAVVFYGMAPPEDRAGAVGCPVLGLYGGLDERVNAGIPAFAAAIERHGKAFERVVYPEALHAFFNDTRPSYDAAASRDAWARTLSLFARTLVFSSTPT